MFFLNYKKDILCIFLFLVPCLSNMIYLLIVHRFHSHMILESACLLIIPNIRTKIPEEIIDYSCIQIQFRIILCNWYAFVITMRNNILMISIVCNIFLQMILLNPDMENEILNNLQYFVVLTVLFNILLFQMEVLSIKAL